VKSLPAIPGFEGFVPRLRVPVPSNYPGEMIQLSTERDIFIGITSPSETLVEPERLPTLAPEQQGWEFLITARRLMKRFDGVFWGCPEGFLVACLRGATSKTLIPTRASFQHDSLPTAGYALLAHVILRLARYLSGDPFAFHEWGSALTVLMKTPFLTCPKETTSLQSLSCLLGETRSSPSLQRGTSIIISTSVHFQSAENH